MQSFEIAKLKDDYEILYGIAHGSFGCVYAVKNKNTQETFAAKVIFFEGENNQNMINHEVSIMARNSHPTIVKFYGYSLTDFNGDERVTLLMQLASKCSLDSMIAKARKEKSDESYNNTVRQKILIGVARGMMYLHQHHIIHRDLKPENVLLDDNFEPLLTDFGISRLVTTEESVRQSNATGTFIYMAPELLGEGEYSGKSDVYSFAILMYEVVTNLVPYPEISGGKGNPFGLSSKIIEANYRPQFTVPVQEPIKKLIKKCWSSNPKERPTFQEIYNRLARNMEESVYDIFDQDEKPYFLEGVDQEAIAAYVDKIDSDSSFVDPSEMISKFTTIMKENEEMKTKISHLEQQNSELVSKFDLILKQLNALLASSPSPLSSHPPDSQLLASHPIDDSPSKYSDEIKIIIKSLQATDLLPVPSGPTNPIILLRFKSTKTKWQAHTKTQHDTINPIWTAPMELYTSNIDDELIMDVMSKAKSNYTTLADQISFNLNQLISGGAPLKQTIQLYQDSTRSAGTLSFEIQAHHTLESEIPLICTYSVSGSQYIRQKYYCCLTCDLDTKLAVCEACARNCHLHHQIGFKANHRAYCDCPDQGGCQVFPDTAKLRCTADEYHRPLNQMMYYCPDCDKTSSKLICQSCAAKFHHEHQVICLGVVEKKVCQHSEIH